ncbi:hypothetical protein JCM10908_001839 [Rhodotorula pacifica]|uniref:mitochondrial 54S ribosomal protein mL54 MRPL37 n=1 Tax=Rhodotorula pacifica TaxID=1495444 RepID=UPI0031715236
MSCTCQRLVSALRQPTRRFATPVVAVRAFASSPRAASTSAPAATAASTIPESSCPAGTVLKNLNFVKDASDPVALEDDKYPAWVWTLTESARKAPTEGADEAANLRHQRKTLKAERKVSMKAANALKG